MKTVNPLVQKVKQIPNEINKTFLENPIIQLLKSSDKQTNKQKETVLRTIKKVDTLHTGNWDKLPWLIVGGNESPLTKSKHILSTGDGEGVT